MLRFPVGERLLRMNHRLSLLVLLAAALALSHSARAGFKVDISPDNGRKDVLTPACENWTIKDGAADSASKTFGDITVTLRSPQKHNLPVTLWKGGLDTGATMSCDGVTVADDLEMAVSGLSTGIHTIVTYHSSPGKGSASTFDLRVTGKPGWEDAQQP